MIEDIFRIIEGYVDDLWFVEHRNAMSKVFRYINEMDIDSYLIHHFESKCCKCRCSRAWILEYILSPEDWIGDWTGIKEYSFCGNCNYPWLHEGD